ncbi:MAG: methyltransferase domain-containing protein [Lentisphaerae bacterium]|nr:methyltransferase domain-containing protein [Lentisphaerota bacterium]MBT4818192.1 methyltransferase domain-containing protein [Lentisphaerota bacterium]MBT5612064.1 methyltransferase domain-containing protein [Lentisphaerota bacterium]MBT7846244.1 methyltransferase domain-containing protein [Lentisphaerota bacterium]
MSDWYQTFADDLWLRPDDVGAEEAAFIKKALRLREAQSVLDAPCGAGRIAIHLAHAGCNVTGVDLRRSFTDRAAARSRRERQSARFLALDLREMEFSSEFHGIYNWLGSFGYFSNTENLDVTRRYAKALRPGGRLLIDQPNRETLLRHFVARRAIRGCVTENRWDGETQRVESDRIVQRNGKTEHNRTSMRLYTPGQMRSLFERVGLDVEAMYGSHDGELYTRSSRRLIVVGRKMESADPAMQVAARASGH